MPDRLLPDAKYEMLKHPLLCPYVDDVLLCEDLENLIRDKRLQPKNYLTVDKYKNDADGIAKSFYFRHRDSGNKLRTDAITSILTNSQYYKVLKGQVARERNLPVDEIDYWSPTDKINYCVTALVKDMVYAQLENKIISSRQVTNG